MHPCLMTSDGGVRRCISACTGRSSGLRVKINRLRWLASVQGNSNEALKRIIDGVVGETLDPGALWPNE